MLHELSDKHTQLTTIEAVCARSALIVEAWPQTPFACTAFDLVVSSYALDSVDWMELMFSLERT